MYIYIYVYIGYIDLCIIGLYDTYLYTYMHV